VKAVVLRARLGSAVAVAVAAVALAAVALIAAGCGRSSPTLRAASPHLARQLMTQRLKTKQLNYTWLACIALPRTWRHIRITRCNVGFGIDPHIEAYCVVLRNGALLTNFEEPSIPCRHDDAGIGRTTITTN